MNGIARAFIILLLLLAILALLAAAGAFFVYKLSRGAEEASAFMKDLHNREMSAAFEPSTEQLSELCRREDLGRRHKAISFGAPLRFTREIRRTDTELVLTATLLDQGETCSGRYAVTGKLDTETAGDYGSMPSTIYKVRFERIRLLERLLPPKAEPGTTPIFPGQWTARHIAPGALEALDDTYLVELPAEQLVFMTFDPNPYAFVYHRSYEDYRMASRTVAKRTIGRKEIGLLAPPQKFPFKLEVVHDGAPIEVFWGVYSEWGEPYFVTTTAGLYRLRVRYGERSPKGVPDKYTFQLMWGEWTGETNGERDPEVVFTGGTPSPADAGAAPPN
jgi:hypothetical protein